MLLLHVKIAFRYSFVDVNHCEACIPSGAYINTPWTKTAIEQLQRLLVDILQTIEACKDFRRFSHV